jgi:hypothetical protein
MIDPTEAMRRNRLAEINGHPADRQELERGTARFGTPTTDELTRDFQVVGFAAPLVVVRRRSDDALGSLEFQHDPRFYFNWQFDRK